MNESNFLLKKRERKHLFPRSKSQGFMEKSEKRENFLQEGGFKNMSSNDLNVARFSAMMCGNFTQENNSMEKMLIFNIVFLNS